MQKSLQRLKASVSFAFVDNGDAIELDIRASAVRPDGAAAKTVVELVRKFERNNAPFALVKVTPETGRKHQIRIHLAHAGHPIVGDKIYGGDPGIYLSFVKSEMTEEQRRKMILTNHALHAGLISFNWTGREVRFETSPEPEFQEFLSGS